jgi:hypothetical protein
VRPRLGCASFRLWWFLAERTAPCYIHCSHLIHSAVLRCAAS